MVITYVNLLHRLTGRVLNTSPDGVIEYDYFANTGNLVLQHAFDFLVVSFSYSYIVGEKLFFGGIVVHSEARIVRGELVLPSSQIVNVSGVVPLCEVAAGAIDLCPRLPFVRGRVNVLEACGSHIEVVGLKDLFSAEEKR
jgi:hypothetical protein